MVETLPVFQKKQRRVQPHPAATAIDQPKMTNAQIRFEKGQSLKHVRKTVYQICAGSLENINQFCLELAAGKYPAC